MSTTIRPETVPDLRVSRRVVVAAAPPVIFALLTDPHAHAALDATGAVRGVVDGPRRLVLGSAFRIRMRGYTTANTVVEFEPDALIAWRHRARHVWRWQLRAVPGGTEVTETFDYTAKRAPRLVRMIGIPHRADAALAATLAALRARFE